MIILILNGLVFGGLLYIVSVGLVLVFGLRRVVNFAHGSLFMIGAYVGFTAAALGNFWLGLLAAAIVLAALGAALDIIVFRPLQQQGHLTTVSWHVWGKPASPSSLGGKFPPISSSLM